jgi:hypothetical protein
VIRIGVTGHSNLSPESTEVVFSGLRDALEPFAGDGLHGTTCLAAGADQLFARAVLSLGGRYDVILPAPDYRDTVVKPGNLADFDALLAGASDVPFMPFETAGRGVHGGQRGAPDLQRSAAGRMGRQAVRGGLGGTADVVGHARRVGVPVDIIWPTGAQRR